MISDIYDFVMNLPVIFQAILVILVAGIIFAVAKSFIKYAIYIALLVVLLLVILRLLNIQVDAPGLQEIIPSKIEF